MPISAALASNLPLVFAFGAVGVALMAWLIRLPRWAVALLPLSLVAGQLVRMPVLGQSGGLLMSDVAVVVVLVAGSVSVVIASKAKRPRSETKAGIAAPRPSEARNDVLRLLIFLPFILWSLWSLIIHYDSLGANNFAIAFAYWVRLAAYLLLLPALATLCRDSKNFMWLKRGLWIAIGLITTLGFVQLMVMPHLAVLGSGWDPHENRLVSTWLDPNFLGAFLGMVGLWLAASLELPLSLRERVWARAKGALVLITILALLLTQSRSSLIAWFVTLMVVSPVIVPLLYKGRPGGVGRIMLVPIVSILLVSLLFGTIFLGDRAIGLIRSDATVQLRQESLKKVFDLAAANSLIGVGYNAYQFAALDAGLISDFSIHSRAGADNSLLTLWVTTGLLGVVLFFAPWIIIGSSLLRRWFLEKNLWALAAVAGLLLLFIHSQFVNSFLYSHLLLTIVIVVAIASRRHSGPVSQHGVNSSRNPEART